MACRSGAPSGPTGAAPSPPPDLLKDFVGQTLILRHLGDERSVDVQQNGLASLKGDCDTVVDVTSGKLDRGTVRFALQTLGRPRLAARGPHQDKCAHDQPQVQLTVAGFAPDASGTDLGTALGHVLQTPDAYLAAHGVPFDLKADSKPAAATPARLLTSPPERLLWADVTRQDPSRHLRFESEVEVEGLVGPDGRFSNGSVLSGLSNEQEESVKHLLPIWRFQPGRKGTDPVAVVVRQRLVLRIYH
jgi:hypothetical protein